jgi:hypothetical protein
MTYALTVSDGTGPIVMPNGLRYSDGDSFTLADEDFGLLTAAAKGLLAAGSGGTETGSLGGDVSHQVTITSGLANVVLPNGIRYAGGAVVVLSDAEYSLIPSGALSGLFSDDTTDLS